jgi:Flp pilus assembly pilin Flp
VFLSLRRGDGQGLAEYALILSLIVIMAIAALMFLSNTVVAMYQNIASLI